MTYKLDEHDKRRLNMKTLIWFFTHPIYAVVWTLTGNPYSHYFGTE